MMNKTRYELETTGFKPKFPERQLRRLKSTPDGAFSVEVFDEKSPSLLRSSDFDVQTILDTNPSLLKPVGLLHPDRLTEHDQVSRYATMLSDQVPFDSGSSVDPGSSVVE